jgi:hypothetical protein
MPSNSVSRIPEYVSAMILECWLSTGDGLNDPSESRNGLVGHTRNNNQFTSGPDEKRAYPALQDNQHNPKNLTEPNDYSR